MVKNQENKETNEEINKKIFSKDDDDNHITWKEEVMFRSWIKSITDNIVFFLLLFMVIVMSLSVTFRITENKMLEDQRIYNQCTEKCSTNDWLVKISTNDHTGSNVIEQLDRTRCIESCNDLYLVMKDKKISCGWSD